MANDYYANAEIAEAYDPGLRDVGAIAVDDIPFYVGLARAAAAKGHKVLELGCGTGRVTIPIAQAGVSVTGLDSAAEMLAIARAKAVDMGIENVTWQQGDMAGFADDARFGLVVIPFRSFLMLLTHEEQRACLTRVHDHLVEGGRLAFNIFNPSPLGMAVWIADNQDMWRRRRPEAGVEDWFKRDFDTATQVLRERQTRLHLSPEGVVTKRTENSLRLRWIHRYEMQYLLELTGFEVETLHGWFDGRDFDRKSEEMVWVARKAG